MKNKGMWPKLDHYVPVLGTLLNIGTLVCPNIGEPTTPSQMGLPKNRAARTVNAPNISPYYYMSKYVMGQYLSEYVSNHRVDTILGISFSIAQFAITPFY